MKAGSHTVILAAGEFPRAGGYARKLLESATRVVCCDGAADVYRRRLHKNPTVVIGDFDSVKRFGEGELAVCRPDQSVNDLEKAIRYCLGRGWKNPVVLGAGGLREDHAIGNVFRAYEYGLDIVSDYGMFTAVEGRRVLKVRKGCAVSLFAPKRGTKMTSKGLQWPLNGLKFSDLYCATLNRTTTSRVELTSNRRVYVYIAF